MGKGIASTSAAHGAAERSGSIAHGGSLNVARRLFPDAPEPLVDLSTGINPIAWPMPDLAREVWAHDVWKRLPEPADIAALEAEAARAYGTLPQNVVAAPGTQILISLLPRIKPLRQVAVLGPTYAEHAAAWRASGAHTIEVSMLADAEGACGVVLCNPNNPDGRRTDPDVLRGLADRLSQRGGLLVVDEAFADLEDAPLSLVPNLPNAGVAVLRSFGKTYGLAGVRLGFLVAPVPLATEVRSALGPWAVSGPAIAIGRAALADAAWLEAARVRLTADAVRLDKLLAGAGFEAAGGTRLFRLVSRADAAEWFERFGRAGILVRRFEHRPDLLRFGIPGPAEHWNRLAAALGILSS